MKKTTAARRLAPEEVLAFMLGDQEYGIDMQNVQEVRGVDALADDARSASLDGGVVNLRGLCVPVIDMRVRFALGEPVYDESTSVIVVNIGGRLMSIVVDGISDVHRLEGTPLGRAPRAQGGLNRDCMIGLGTFGEHKVILLAVDKLLSGEGSMPATMAAQHQ